jgi:putative Holliday junction resolvase
VERYLCLDIGDKRIGVAVSDPFNSYALPVETYHRKNLKTDLEKIVGYIKQKGATTLVCGLPVNFDGTPSIQTNKAKFFIDRLIEIVPVKVVTVDERCSTVEAEEILIEQNKSREERKSVIDSLAATTILNGYLFDVNKNKKI